MPGAWAQDYDGAIEAWVERGAAPDRMTARHVNRLVPIFVTYGSPIPYEDRH